MDQQLFRKESLERISSPEELHDYMKVTSPRMWMILIGIAALLTGFIVYASTLTLESTMEFKVLSSDGKLYGVQEDPQGSLDLDMPVRIGELTGRLSDLSETETVTASLRTGDGAALSEGYYAFEFTGEDAPAKMKDTPIIVYVSGETVSFYNGGSVIAEYLSSEKAVRIGGRHVFLSNPKRSAAKSFTIELDSGETVLPDGTYDASVVIDSSSPIHFLMN